MKTIAELVEILKTVKYTGLEREYNPPFRSIHPENTFYYQVTLQSCLGEATIFGQNSIELSIRDIDGFNLETVFVLAVYNLYQYGRNSDYYQDKMYQINVARLSSLFDYPIDMIVIYKILEYLDYDLPNKEKFIEIVEGNEDENDNADTN